MNRNRPKRLLIWLKQHGSSFAVFLLFIVGIVVLSRTLHQTSLQDIYARKQALPSGKILLAMFFTLLNYAALTGYDWSALRYMGKKLSFPVIAFTSFTRHLMCTDPVLPAGYRSCRSNIIYFAPRWNNFIFRFYRSLCHCACLGRYQFRTGGPWCF